MRRRGFAEKGAKRQCQVVEVKLLRRELAGYLQPDRLAGRRVRRTPP
jgi:hypothetical protein